MVTEFLPVDVIPLKERGRQVLLSHVVAALFVNCERSLSYPIIRALKDSHTSAFTFVFFMWSACGRGRGHVRLCVCVCACREYLWRPEVDISSFDYSPSYSLGQSFSVKHIAHLCS